MTWRFTYQPDGFGIISEGWGWNCYLHKTIDEVTEIALPCSFEKGLTWEDLAEVEYLMRLIVEAEKSSS